MPSVGRSLRLTNKSPIRRWPIRCGVGPELPGQSLDVSGRRVEEHPCEFITGCLNACRTMPLSRFWSRRRRCGWISRTAAGPTFFSSAWIFPRVRGSLNISVDLGVHGRDPAPTPPIETRVRRSPSQSLRFTSIDLNACKDVDSLEELFNFGNDYLGLIKAAVVASGLVPPSLEGTHRGSPTCSAIVRDGHGLEIVSKVNDIPKGSRWRSRPICWPR